jgi:ribulose-5-phosphate 4-epimerase/fuculose-1-phosphate aldolase
MVQVSSVRPLPGELAGTVLSGQPSSGRLRWFADGLTRTLRAHGHLLLDEEQANPRLVIQFTPADRPRPYRRNAQGTFVVSVVEVSETPADILRAAYPLLVRSLSNLLIYVVNPPQSEQWQTYFITLEQGYYRIDMAPGAETDYFAAVYQRLEPLATSQLVVNNIYTHDLPEALRNGDESTRELQQAGRMLAALNLLPAPFPIEDWLGERDMTHVKRLFGIGGLSYGNLSVRRDDSSFWMSASGVDKSQMAVVGRDMLLITGYDAANRAMLVRAPEGIEPRRASVDAIEHWMLYTEHPTVGAIIHVHAWMEGIPSTMVNYPCGTAELATEVAELVRQQPDPSRAVIGLKNHGLTITGRNLPEIFARIKGRLLPQVPMS